MVLYKVNNRRSGAVVGYVKAQSSKIAREKINKEIGVIGREVVFYRCYKYDPNYAEMEAEAEEFFKTGRCALDRNDILETLKFMYWDTAKFVTEADDRTQDVFKVSLTNDIHCCVTYTYGIKQLVLCVHDIHPNRALMRLERVYKGICKTKSDLERILESCVKSYDVTTFNRHPVTEIEQAITKGYY